MDARGSLVKDSRDRKAADGQSDRVSVQPVSDARVFLPGDGWVVRGDLGEYFVGVV